MIISWPRVVTVSTLSERVLKVEPTGCVDRGAMGIEIRNTHPTIVFQCLCVFKEGRKAVTCPLPKEIIHTHINTYIVLVT